MLMPTQKGNKDKDSDGCMICFQHIGKILYFWTLNLRYRIFYQDYKTDIIPLI